MKEQKQAAQTSLAKQKETKKIQTATRFLQKQQPEITDFDESLVGHLIERITIEEGRIKVRFKSGMEVEQ